MEESQTCVLRLKPETTETNCSFPDDLVSEILSWLPVRQLLIFRCVNKSWCAIVDNPIFINKHHERQYGAILKDKGHIPLFLNGTTTSILPYLDLSYSLEDVATQFHFLSKRYEDVVFLELEDSSHKPCQEMKQFAEIECIGCTNGVVLFEWHWQFSPYCAYLGMWNPATREFKVVPCVPRSCKEYHCDKSALGFDPKSNDIKIIRQIFRPSNSRMIYHAYEMYSLKTNSWKSIECPSHPEHKPSIGRSDRGVYINNIHYWPYDRIDHDSQKSNLILSFDFCNEIFRFLSQPRTEDEYDCSLVNYKGSLACICYPAIPIPVRPYKPEISTPLDIWVMSKVDDHGIPSAWQHLFTIGPFPEKNVLFCSFRVGGDMLLTLYDIPDDDEDRPGECFLYDPATKMITKRFEFGFVSCYEYVESLLKLTKRI